MTNKINTKLTGYISSKDMSTKGNKNLIPILRQVGPAEPGRLINGTKDFEADRGVIIYRSHAYNLQQVEKLIRTKISKAGVKPVDQLFVGHQVLRDRVDTYALVLYSRSVSISDPKYYDILPNGKSELWQIVGDSSYEYYLRYMATHVRGCDKLVYLLAIYKDATKAILSHWKIVFINILTGPKDECVTNWICDTYDHVTEQHDWAKYMKEGCSKDWPCDWDYHILSNSEQLMTLIADIDNNSRTGWTRFGLILVVTPDLEHNEVLYQRVHELTTRRNDDSLVAYQYVWILCNFLPDPELMRSGRWRVLQVDRTIADLPSSKRLIAKAKRRAAYNTSLLEYQSRTDFTLLHLQEGCTSYSTIVDEEEEMSVQVEELEVTERAVEIESTVMSLPPISVSTACSIVGMDKKIWKIGDIRVLTSEEVTIIEQASQLPEREGMNWDTIPDKGSDDYDPDNCSIDNWDLVHYSIPQDFCINFLKQYHTDLGITNEQVIMAEYDRQRLLALISPICRCYIARYYYLSRTEIHQSTISIMVDTEIHWQYIRSSGRYDTLRELEAYSRRPGITYIRS